jgi:hypothetical protein
MITTSLSGLVRAGVEASIGTDKFTDVNGNPNMSVAGGALLLSSLIFMVVLFVLILIFGKWLWNNYVTKFVTIFRPVNSVLDLIVLLFALDIFFRCV